MVEQSPCNNNDDAGRLRASSSADNVAIRARPNSLFGGRGENNALENENNQQPDPLSPSPSQVNFNTSHFADEEVPTSSMSTRTSRSETINQQVLSDVEEASSNAGPTFSKHHTTSSESVLVVARQPTSSGPRSPASSEDFKPTVRERNAQMFLNEDLADVRFLVGFEDGMKELIPAHSYVLATSSSAFRAMFYGGFSPDTQITVPDVEPEAFKTMLRYLYTDEVRLTVDNALPVLYVSKKYLISYLYKEAVRFLEKKLNAYNVCVFLSEGQLFSEEDLAERCWELVDAQAEKVLQSDGFLAADYETVRQIISRSSLNVNEKTVYDRAVEWAKDECKRRDLQENAACVREVLRDAFFQIRLTEMTLDEFANGPALEDYLTPQEKTDIFLWFCAASKPSLPFITQPRRGLPIQTCHRYQGCAYRSNQWRYRGRYDGIQFCTDRRIFVAGYGFYGSSTGAAQYKVKMELRKDAEHLAVKETTLSCDGSSRIYAIMFDEPVQAEADEVYTALVIVEGKELSYFGQEGQAEVKCAVDERRFVTFAFSPSAESRNGTGIQGGQIPQILFYC